MKDHDSSRDYILAKHYNTISQYRSLTTTSSCYMHTVSMTPAFMVGSPAGALFVPYRTTGIYRNIYITIWLYLSYFNLTLAVITLQHTAVINAS